MPRFNVRSVVPVVLIALLTSSLNAQAATESPSTASSLITKAVAAFSTNAVSSVHLTGTAREIAGATDDSGTFVFDEASDGSSTLALKTGQSSRTISLVKFGKDPTCSWIDSTGTQHDVPVHNCLRSLDWILPSYSLTAVQSSVASQASCPDAASTSACVQIWRSLSKSSQRAQNWVRRLSAVSLTLDSATNLPISLAFNSHPDDDASTNIPVLVRYSDYRSVSGTMVPFHIQKFLNNGLVLDLTVSSATVQ